MRDTKREVLIVCFVAMMAFTFQFEAALVTVSLPDMARELSISAASVSLVLLSYLLGAVITFVPAGMLGDRHGLRNVCLVGCMVATAGTILCGVSQSIDSLVLGRLIQGIGAGAFVATGYAMMPSWVSEERVGWGYGMQSLGAGTGMVLGVPAGGVLSQFLNWQWIFLASLPLFAALLIAAWRILPDARQQALNRCVAIHWGAVSMFALLMIAVTVLLSGGPAFGWLSLPVLSACGFTGLMLIGLAAAAGSGRPLFSTGVFQGGSTTPALASMLLMAALAGGVRYVLPFYLELACGLSVLASSYALLAYPLGYGPVSVFAGRISDRYGSRRIVLLATLLCALLCAVFAVASGTNQFLLAVAFLLAFGAVTGLYFAPANRLIMRAMPDGVRGEAGGALSVVFNFGTLLGVAVFQATMAWRVEDAIPHAASGLDVSQSFVTGAALAAAAVLLIWRIKPQAQDVA